jgi:hypothetical protein
MTTSFAKTNKERVALSRLRQIFIENDGMLRASLVEMKRYCGTQSCRCTKGKRHWHASWYASQSRQGKLRMKSVPPEQLEDVRRWVRRFREARRLLAVVGDEYWGRIGKQEKAQK